MHIYEVNGRQVPSVTTIIHSLGNDEIIKWANSLGFRHLNYDKELEKYAANGTMIHDLLREEVDPNYKSEVVFKDPFQRSEVLGYLTRFRNLIKDYEFETIFTEKTFISDKLGYGGTIDWFALFFNKYYMLNDFKTSKAVRFSHLLQLGGYRNLLLENGYNINGAAIILCNKKISSLYPIGLVDLEWYSEAFQKLADYYNMTWQHEIKPDMELLNTLKSTKS